MITALVFSAITVAPHISVPHIAPHIAPAPVRVAPAPVRVAPAPAKVAPAPEPVKVAPIIAPAPHIAPKCDEKKEKCK
jgi:hypothetical protein